MIKRVFLASLLFFIANAHAYKYYLSACAIFQNEAPYFKEWIEFHKLVGVEHFYLINNLSTDNYKEVLKPYIDANEVTLVDWPHSNEGKIWARVQTGAYNHLLPVFCRTSRWVMFLDLDEFFTPMKGNSIPPILKDYEEFGGVAVNWQFYGTSFVKKVPADKLMIEMLIRRAPETDLSQRAVKCIVNPQCIIATAQHNFTYKPPFFQVDTAKNQFTGPGSPTICYDVMKVAHYWTRDEDYFERFKKPRREKVGKKIDVYERRDSGNKIEDLDMLRFVTALRERVFKK